MKIFDTVGLKIIKIGDSSGIIFPIEYEALEGIEAEFSAGVEGGDLVLTIRPRIKDIVLDTVEELWEGMRALFSKVGDIGDLPGAELEVVWQVSHPFEGQVPIDASEVIQYRNIGNMTGDKEDIRKSIHDTISKLGELAALRLEFKDETFARAFGAAVGNNYAFGQASLYGMPDIVFEIFNEEFAKVEDDPYWRLSSETAQKAVRAAYDKIRHLEAHPLEYEREKARIEKKWGIWVKPA